MKTVKHINRYHSGNGKVISCEEWVEYKIAKEETHKDKLYVMRQYGTGNGIKAKGYDAMHFDVLLNAPFERNYKIVYLLDYDIVAQYEILHEIKGPGKGRFLLSSKVEEVGFPHREIDHKLAKDLFYEPVLPKYVRLYGTNGTCDDEMQKVILGWYIEDVKHNLNLYPEDVQSPIINKLIKLRLLTYEGLNEQAKSGVIAALIS
jgi:hypothetical protein